MVRVRIKLERLIRGGSIGKGWVLHRRGDMVSGVWNAYTDSKDDQVANTTAAKPGRMGNALILNCQFVTTICSVDDCLCRRCYSLLTSVWVSAIQD